MGKRRSASSPARYQRSERRHRESMSQIMQTWPVTVGDAPQTDLPG